MSNIVPLIGFGGGGGLQESKIVNNFTTTEPGFVADARTVKLLNDRLTHTTFDVTATIAHTSQITTLFKIGRIVTGYLAISGVSLSATTWHTVGTTPVKPAAAVTLPAINSASGAYMGLFNITEDGVLRVYPASAVNNGSISCCVFYVCADEGGASS